MWANDIKFIQRQLRTLYKVTTKQNKIKFIDCVKTLSFFIY